MATLIVLNGTSSSGKTSIARAVQEAMPRLFLNFSADTILQTLPPSVLQRISTGADIGDLPLAKLIRGFYACVGELLRLGHDVIIDHAATARYHAEALLLASEGHDVLLVGLECPLEVLLQREQVRGNRAPGLAQRQAESIHRWLEYDLVIDTSRVSPGEAAGLIAASLTRTRQGLSQTRVKLKNPVPLPLDPEPR